jgi:hypothetical protein
MSRRRLASNIPTLQLQVKLPSPPAASFFRFVSSPPEKTKSAKRSPLLTIITPSFPTVPDQSNLVPVTPVDQTISMSAQPPELRRSSMKTCTFQDHGNKVLNPFSEDMSSISSAQAKDLPTAELYALHLKEVPITPVDQVMSIPSYPPTLPLRRSKQSIMREDRKTTVPISDDDKANYLAPEQLSLTSTPFKCTLRNQPTTGFRQPGYFQGKKCETSPSVGVVDPDKTPTPSNANRLRLPNGRLPSFIHLVERSKVSKECESPRSPVSPSYLGLIGGGQLPLASPFIGDDTANIRYLMEPRESTPLAGPTTSVGAHDRYVGSPSYFAARSYFVRN